MSFDVWRNHVRLQLKRLKYQLLGRMPRINDAILAPSGRCPRYVDPLAQRGCDFDYPERGSRGAADRLVSCLCTQEQLVSRAFRYWIGRTGAPFRVHRKLWEHAYILQAAFERNLLKPGARGLGFAVGEEPLPKLFASYGCEIVATDLDIDDPRSKVWRTSGQHLSSISQEGSMIRLPAAGSVAFRNVDMNHIPADLSGFDFTWSTCSFEHCGSINLGQQFIWNQMRCLKPGGVAIHTTEFNLTSDDHTIEQGGTVLFRRQDVEAIVDKLLAQGHDVEPLALDPGTGQFDRYIDWPPYSQDKHLRLQLSRYAATSIGLIIRKSTANALAFSA